MGRLWMTPDTGPASATTSTGTSTTGRCRVAKLARVSHRPEIGSVSLSGLPAPLFGRQSQGSHPPPAEAPRLPHRQWKDGKRHGWGRMEWHDGNVYEGTWADDLVCLGLPGRTRPEPHFLRSGYRPSPPRTALLRGSASAAMAGAYRQRRRGGGGAAGRWHPAATLWNSGAPPPAQRHVPRAA
jgi:hypothetical protein